MLLRAYNNVGKCVYAVSFLSLSPSLQRVVGFALSVQLIRLGVL